jgi:IS30 family transposase
MERLSESDRNELWDLWEAGESQRSIGRWLGRSPSTVRTQLASSRDVQGLKGAYVSFASSAHAHAEKRRDDRDPAQDVHNGKQLRHIR